MSNHTELMQHALGINERNREPYRNYFLASGEHPENEVWKQLVSDGFALASPAPEWSCGNVIYRVTDAGKAVAIAALPAQKKPSNYDKYLDADTCCSFGEFLLGNKQPEFEYRNGKVRMYRLNRISWDSVYDVQGEWCDTQKAAKASYKDALKKHREGLKR